jgi:hypothetical protein
MPVIIRVMRIFTTGTRGGNAHLDGWCSLHLRRNLTRGGSQSIAPRQAYRLYNDSGTPHVDRKLSVLGITERKLGRRHKPENEAWTPTF